MNIIIAFLRGMKCIFLYSLLCFASTPVYSIDWEKAPDHSWIRVTYFDSADVDLDASPEDLNSAYGSVHVYAYDGKYYYSHDLKGLVCKSERDFDSILQSHVTGLNIDNIRTASSPGVSFNVLCATKMTSDGNMDVNSKVYLRRWYSSGGPPVYNSCTLQVGGPYDVKIGAGGSEVINGEYSIECGLESNVVVEFKNEGVASDFPEGLSASAKMDNGNVSEELENVSAILTRHFSINVTSDSSVEPGNYSGTIVVLATPH